MAVNAIKIRFHPASAVTALPVTAKGMRGVEYEAATDVMRQCFGIACPSAAELLLGGIIGSLEIVDAVRYAHQSPWSFGPYGFVLLEPEPCAIPSN